MTKCDCMYSNEPLDWHRLSPFAFFKSLYLVLRMLQYFFFLRHTNHLFRLFLSCADFQRKRPQIPSNVDVPFYQALLKRSK